MTEKPRILFIVEGEKLEPEIIERMAVLYHMQCEVASVCTNIHALYCDLKKDNGFLDVIAVMKELLVRKIKNLNSEIPDRDKRKQIHSAQKDLEKLNHKFAYRYLVFDSELQHGRRGTAVSRQEQLKKNYGELADMLDFFNDEADQGKLFINYPMMESYRDCDAFFDEKYKDRTVTLDTLFAGKYKNQVGKRILSNVRTEKITRPDFDLLIRMNVFKLNWIESRNWNGMSYENFRDFSRQEQILKAEQVFSTTENALAVLNTLLFFPLDYFGRNLYNEIIPSELTRDPAVTAGGKS